jgi:microcystin-dependent protein
MPTEPLIGTVMLFSTFRGAPNGWVSCNGQLLAISEYTPLFALIGTTYGGDGQSTFAVPDLRSRVPIHFGQGAGLSDRIIGGASGTESVTLQATHLPSHTHAVGVTSAANTVGVPSNSVTLGVAQLDVYSSQTANVALHPQTISNVGGNQPHENRQPFMAMNYVIAVEGIFPSGS